MTKIKKMLKEVQKLANTASNGDDPMRNPKYLDASHEIISSSLKKGYDVIQLDNGDIIVTGVKVEVIKYHWDTEKSKMNRRKIKQSKSD